MLTGLLLMQVFWLALAGVALDCLLGEARRWHPLVGFGAYASWLERHFNRDGPAALRIMRGALAWLLAVAPFTLFLAWVVGAVPPVLAMVLHALTLYFCLGLRSLRDHTKPIAAALAGGDLPAARGLTARIVSRDTGHADESDLAKAAVESLLENGNDAVFGTLFWFVVAGAPGALLFRLANTLDAMWGYRSARFNLFGRTAARLDDVLSWLPARLTALSYAALGRTRLALRCWREQAPAWPSPNAGPVMSAGAGALGLMLGGEATYGGVVEVRPPLGSGRAAAQGDIARAWQLVARGVVLWLVVLAFAAMLPR